VPTLSVGRVLAASRAASLAQARTAAAVMGLLLSAQRAQGASLARTATSAKGVTLGAARATAVGIGRVAAYAAVGLKADATLTVEAATAVALTVSDTD
jgi:hypothetical protein